jgi:hypothetical protein
MTETIIDIFNLNLEDLNKLLIDDKIIIDEKLIIDRYIRACVIKYSKLDETSKLIIYIEDSKDQNKYGKFFYKYLLSDHVNNITDVRDYVIKVYNVFKTCSFNTFDNNLDPIDPITGTSINEKNIITYEKVCYDTLENEIKIEFRKKQIDIDNLKIKKLSERLSIFISGDNYDEIEIERIYEDIYEDNYNKKLILRILNNITSSFFFKKSELV